MTGIIRLQVGCCLLKHSICSYVVGHNLKGRPLIEVLKALGMNFSHFSVEKWRSKLRGIVEKFFNFFFFSQLLKLSQLLVSLLPGHLLFGPLSEQLHLGVKVLDVLGGNHVFLHLLFNRIN